MNLTNKIKEFDILNFFISPISIAEPLCALMNGSNQSSKKEIRNLLHINQIEVEKINQFIFHINEILKNSSTFFQIGNSAWISEDYIPQEKISEIFFKDYNMCFNKLSETSVKDMNNWISEFTKGKIKTSIEKVSPDTKLILLNTVYFKGEWKHEFKKKLTKESPFHSPSGNRFVPMMQLDAVLAYKKNEIYESIKLPYKSDQGKDVRFLSTIILPNEGQLKKTIEMLSSNYESILNDNFEICGGLLFLPRFKISYSSKLNDILQSMGMYSPFQPGNFPSLTTPENLYIGEIIHKTHLEVNEKGTEATGVTTVKMIMKMAMVQPKFFMKVDRPFIFTIQEEQTGLILFIGVIQEVE